MWTGERPQVKRCMNVNLTCYVWLPYSRAKPPIVSTCFCFHFSPFCIPITILLESLWIHILVLSSVHCFANGLNIKWYHIAILNSLSIDNIKHLFIFYIGESVSLCYMSIHVFTSPVFKSICSDFILGNHWTTTYI